MANRKRLDRKGRPYRKMDSQTYDDYKWWDMYRKWLKWGRKGNLNRYFKAGYE